MARFIQVLNGEVTNHWDIPDTLPSPLGTKGWTTTVEQIPTIVEGRQVYGSYTYDVTKDPVVISREIIDISVEDRKKELLEKNNSDFLNFISIFQTSPSFYTDEELISIKNIARNNKQMVISAKTHDELDSLNLVPLELF